MQRARSLWADLAPGLVAGLVGAVSIDLYLIVTLVYLTHATTLVGLYQYVASGAVGRSAFDSPASVGLGIVAHLLVSIAWGIGYAFVAMRTPAIRSRPALSGAAFGFVVFIAMQIVEVAANIYRVPSSFSLANGVIAHVLFFGLPIAYIVRARSHP